jgi:hypothetical protein
LVSDFGDSAPNTTSATSSLYERPGIEKPIANSPEPVSVPAKRPKLLYQPEVSDRRPVRWNQPEHDGVISRPV